MEYSAYTEIQNKPRNNKTIMGIDLISHALYLQSFKVTPFVGLEKQQDNDGHRPHTTCSALTKFQSHAFCRS